MTDTEPTVEDVQVLLQRMSRAERRRLAAEFMHAQVTAEVERLRKALIEISVGEGIYGPQAGEYKKIARDALTQEERD